MWAFLYSKQGCRFIVLGEIPGVFTPLSSMLPCHSCIFPLIFVTQFIALLAVLHCTVFILCSNFVNQFLLHCLLYALCIYCRDHFQIPFLKSYVHAHVICNTDGQKTACQNVRKRFCRWWSFYDRGRDKWRINTSLSPTTFLPFASVWKQSFNQPSRYSPK